MLAPQAITDKGQTLARLASELALCPAHMADLPYRVDETTFDHAEAEMREIMRERGFEMARCPGLTTRNFMVFGRIVECGAHG